MTDLIRVTRGVWRPAGTVDSLAGRCAALLAAVPPGTVIGGATAARLHGIWLPDGAGDGPVELLLRRNAAIPTAHSGSRRGEVRGRRRHVLPDEVEQLDGLPITSLGRTWLDLAERLSLPDLVAAGDFVLRAGTPTAQLDDLVHRAVHRRGVVRARAACPLLNARSRSRPESHLRYALVADGLPEPAVNVAIFSGLGEWLSEPDLSYDDVRLALEYNGADHAKVRRMRRDITREIDVAMRGGWRTETFGPAEVFGRPDQIAAYVRDLRFDRSRGLG